MWDWGRDQAVASEALQADVQRRLDETFGGEPTPEQAFLTCDHSDACARLLGVLSSAGEDSRRPWSWLECGECDCWEGR